MIQPVMFRCNECERNILGQPHEEIFCPTCDKPMSPFKTVEKGIAVSPGKHPIYVDYDELKRFSAFMDGLKGDHGKTITASDALAILLDESPEVYHDGTRR